MKFHTSLREVNCLVNVKRSLEDSFVGTVTIGERGQVVIPADARKKLDLHTGDTLMIMTHPERQGLMMVKIDAVREFLSHMAANLSMVDAEGMTESDQPGHENREE
jgi:AbrB family looped-hinge helix DNA binding protein